METGFPPQTMYAKPRMIDCVTRVAINASRWILLTINALKYPTTAPQRMVSATAAANGIPFPTKSAATTPEKAAREPGDKSF